MKTLLLIPIVGLMMTFLPPPSAGAETFFIFKASVAVPVEYVVLGQEVDKVFVKTITSKELVNLKLGRPIDTVLDKESEILAFQLAYEDPANGTNPIDPPTTKLIIWDTTAVGPARKKAEIGTLTALDFDQAYTSKGIKGQGLATGVIAESTADPNGNNKIFATTLHGAGHASHPFAQGNILNFTLALSGLSGRVHLKYTDRKNAAPVEIVGVAVKGTAKASGKALAVFEE